MRQTAPWEQPALTVMARAPNSARKDWHLHIAASNFRRGRILAVNFTLGNFKAWFPFCKKLYLLHLSGDGTSSMTPRLTRFPASASTIEYVKGMPNARKFRKL